MRLPQGSRKSQRNRGSSFKPYFSSTFLRTSVSCFFVAHDESKMTDPVRLDPLDFEDGEKLVLPQFQKGVAFATIHLLQIEDILIKSHRRFDIIHFNREWLHP